MMFPTASRLVPFPDRRRLAAWLFACAALLAPAWAQGPAERVEALESLGRGQPLEAAAELDALIPTLEPFSAERLEALAVRGLLLAAGAHKHAAENVAADLDRWARARNAPEAAAAALAVRARAVSHSGELKRADRLYAEALARLPDIAPAAARYRLVLRAAEVKELLGQLEDAVRLGQQAQALADAVGVPWRRSEARSKLAFGYFQARQVERARALNDEAIAIADAAQDWQALARAHNVASIVLGAFDDAPGELRHMQLAIDFARRAGITSDEALYLANLADYYLKTGDYPTALELAEKALPLARALQDLNGESVALANIGLAHIGLKQLVLGKRFLAEAIAIDEKRGSLSGVSLFQSELGTYLERAGDWAAAVEAFHRHRGLADDILQRDQQDAILALQEQFDADRRDRELALLNRDNQIKAEQLRRDELRERLWWLLAALALVSIAVFVLLSRRVRRANLALARSNRALKVQSESDPLTGLANRRQIQAAFASRAAAAEPFSGSLYLIDVDRFKRINDDHGHAAGDAVLVEVARRLAATLREQDMIVRWGGEEFLVVVRTLAGGVQVDALAQRLLAAIAAEPVRHEGLALAVTGSIGYASFPMAPANVAVAWERAVNLVDTAMYLAKAHGRHRAYGVRAIHADDEAGVERIARSLEAAWREGQVELTLVRGDDPMEAAA